MPNRRVSRSWNYVFSMFQCVAIRYRITRSKAIFEIIRVHTGIDVS